MLVTDVDAVEVLLIGAEKSAYKHYKDFTASLYSLSPFNI